MIEIEGAALKLPPKGHCPFGIPLYMETEGINMGKIKTEGRVTLEFELDFYEISITVRAEGKTSGAAVTAGKKQTEQLLQVLQDELGIKPEQISALCCVSLDAAAIRAKELGWA